MGSLRETLRSTWSSIFGKNVHKRRRQAIRLAAGDHLESRLLLATLVNTTTLTYQDTDGDNVTVSFSRPILTNATVANSVFTFDTGTVNGSNAGKQQLRSINLASLPAAAGTTITTTAVRSATTGGDGFAALGQINATGRDISTVTIDGDLGRILAGDAVGTTQGAAFSRVCRCEFAPIRLYAG